MSETLKLPTCGKCGAALSGYAPDGLCAACLLDSAFEERDVQFGGPAKPTPLLAFKDYELLEEIARGGMGVVYRARQISLNRLVAIKMILGGHLANAAEMHRFRVEAETAAQLQHPNIVAIHEVGEHAGQPFFSMDFVPGRSLAQWVHDGPLPARKAATYLKTIAEAVQYAHSCSVLHRDLKPSNILIDDADQPRVTDFGLAKRLDDPQLSPTDSQLTQTGQVLGSPSFIPPEQAAGQRDKIGPASDVYSLGAMLYHCLTARPPFMAETLTQTLRMVAENDAVSPRLLNPSVPRDLETICLKCLEKDPQRRYATAQELADELARFLRDEPIHARPIGHGEKFQRWTHRHPIIAMLTGIIGLLLVTVAVISTLAVARLKHANREGQEKLREAYLSQAQANRWSGRPGRRFDSLEAIRKAVAIRPGLDLRNEAIAALALMDLQPAKTWESKQSYHIFDPRYERYALGPANGLISIRRVRDDVEIARLPDFGLPAFEAAFSPDGRLLGVHHRRNHDYAFKVYDLENSQKVRLDVPGRWVRAFRFSSDGRRLVVAWKEDQGVSNLTFYDLDEGAEGNPIPLETLPYGLTFNSDASRIAVSSTDSDRVQILSVPDGKQLQTLVHPTGVHGLAWASNDRFVAAAGMDGYVHLWDLYASPPTATLLPQEAVSTTCSFNSSGEYLMSIGWNLLAKIWSVPTGQELLRLPAGMIGHFSPDDRWVGGSHGQGSVTVSRFAAGNECRTYFAKKAIGTHGLALSPDGRWLASGHNDGLRLWDLATGFECHYGAVGTPFDLQFSADGQTLVTSLPDKVLRWPIRATSQGRITQIEVGPPTPLNPETPGMINPTNRMLAVANGIAHVFDAKSGRLERQLKCPEGVFCGAVSSDGRYCATWGRNALSVLVWDAETGRRLALLDLAHSPCVAFSPNGRWLITGSSSEYVFWESESWSRRQTISRGMTGGSHGQVAFTHDGAMVALALGRGDIGVFDAATLEPLATLESPKGNALSGLDFSADGSRLAASATGQAIHVWDLQLIRGQLAELSLDLDRPAMPVPSRAGVIKLTLINESGSRTNGEGGARPAFLPASN